jgi:succinate dehydrogenase/fumarate reductase flavoprotein subunit
MSRSSFLEMTAGRGCKHGGVEIVAAHLGAEFVEKNFPGMCERCKLFGYDLARKPVPVSPTAHYVMGGAVIDTACHTSLERLFAAGEDAGGTHGANRLGGNGIADSCVYGRLAGKSMAQYLKQERGIPQADESQIEHLTAHYLAPFERTSGPFPLTLRDELREMNWTHVGIARTAEKLQQAIEEIEKIHQESMMAQLKGTGSRAYNMLWQDWISLLNMLDVSRMISTSALQRQETRGAHFRLDYPKQDDHYGLFNIFLSRGANGRPILEKRPVTLKYMKPTDVVK